MLFYYLAYVLLIGLKLSIAERYRAINTNHDNIISISSVLGTPLIFNTQILDKLIDDEGFKKIIWYKGISDLQPIINSHGSSRSRFQIINQTKLLITHTFIGDEGFYTLKIQTKLNINKQYHYHVILFTLNLSLVLSPPSSSSDNYHAEQQINFTCSISFLANRTYIERTRSLFLSTWSMIIYNNDPDLYQLLSSSSTSYTYTASLVNYELNRNDHNQSISCSLIQQQTMIQNVTLINQLNVRYKAYLRGNYYFTRSFNAYSSIEINCEEFNANPKPVYTLLWVLNGENRTLLNKTKHGRYFIENATWRNRGNYTCLAENDLNNHQPAHQSFRLNIWFNDHRSQPEKILALQYRSLLNKNRSVILILLIVFFLLACLFFILSIYYFCLQMK